MAKVGRPRKYESPEDMQDMINKYFNSITKTDLMWREIVVGYEDKAKKKPIIKQEPILNDNGEQRSHTYYFEEPTIISLCRYLDLDRTNFAEYGNLEEFHSTVKNAKARVEEYLERQLYRKDQVTGIIFNLKNNFGWKDKQDIDMTANTNNVNHNLDYNNMSDDELEQTLAKLRNNDV